jgi:uncharacterized protein DUF6459
MTAAAQPMPVQPAQPRTPVLSAVPALPDNDPAIRVCPVADTDPPYDRDPFWDRPRLRPVPEAVAAAPVADVEPPTGPESGPPGAELAAHRLVHAYLDVLHGRRRPSQLTALATVRGTERLYRALGEPGQPWRRVRLGRLHVAEPLPGIAECAAVLREAGSAWALAFRLEHRGGAWQCTDADSVVREQHSPARRVGER